MIKESTLLKELTDLSIKTGKFKFEEKKNMILLNQNNKMITTTISWTFVILIVPILMLFSGENLVLKLLISIPYSSFIIYQFIKTSKSNRNVLINKNKKQISLMVQSDLTKIIIPDSLIHFNQIKIISTDRRTTYSQYGGSMSTYVIVDLGEEKLTISTFDDDLIARRFAFLLRLIIKQHASNNN